MTKELLGRGAFRDRNNEQWDISVYRDDSSGRVMHDTVVRSPEGEYYRPDEDILGDFKLIDKHGNERREDLPMDIDEFQVALERIEEKAWGYSSPLLNPIRSASQKQPEPKPEGSLSEQLRAHAERISSGSQQQPEAEPEGTLSEQLRAHAERIRSGAQAEPEAEPEPEKGGWRERMSALAERIASSGREC